MDVENEAESLLVPEEGSGPETRLDVCPVCGLNLRSRGAKLLPCLHSICHRCSPAATRNLAPTCGGKALIRCPVCRRECGEADVMENLFVKDAVESPSSTVDGTTQLCMTCDDHSEASSFCVNCSEYLCGACVEAHRRVKFTRDHKLRPKSDAAAAEVSSQRPMFCDSHRQEALKLYCETCDLLTCRDCQLLQHKDHRYQFLADAVQSLRQHLESMTQQLQEKQRLIEEVSHSVQERLQRVSQNRSSVRKQITASVCSLVEQINRKEKQLIHQLEAVTQEQQSVLLKQQEDVADLSRRLQHVLKFTMWATSRNGTVALLHCKRMIMLQIENLLQAKCSTTFTPLGGVRFQCRSSYWASGVDLGSLVVEHQRDPGVPAPQSGLTPSSSPLSFTSRTSHNTLAQLQMQVEKIDPNWPPPAPWCQSVRLPRTAPTQSRRQPPTSHMATSLPGSGRTPQISGKLSGALSLQPPTPQREDLGIQVPPGSQDENKEEKPSLQEMVTLGSSVRKRRRSSPGPDVAIKKEPNCDLSEVKPDL
ncbi:transcription intermediary factor 1-alpha-like [Synchiropus picturatus]